MGQGMRVSLFSPSPLAGEGLGRGGERKTAALQEPTSLLNIRNQRLSIQMQLLQHMPLIRR
jgi:hypothetical protein